MSGSGGGIGGGSESFDLVCENVNFKAPLRSVPEDVIDTIELKMRFQVVENDGRVEAVNSETGDFMGSITWTKNVELVRCISEGHEYVAVVQKIDGGLITVQVTPA